MAPLLERKSKMKYLVRLNLRVKIQKFLRILILIFGLSFVSPLSFSAQTFPRCIMRSHEIEKKNSPCFSVKPLRNRGHISEVYIYEDLRYPNGDVPFVDKKKIDAAFKRFDEFIYFQYIRSLVPDPAGESRKSNPIILLFDNIRDRKWRNSSPEKEYYGYYEPFLSRTYERDILILDINSSLGELNYLLTHEMQHMFRDRYSDGLESRWLDEGLSKFAEYYLSDLHSGDGQREFPTWQLEDFAMNPSRPLRYRYQVLSESSYFNNFLFVYYLYSHFGGIETIRKLMTSKNGDLLNIENTLKSMQKLETRTSKRDFYNFKDIFLNYQVALVANPIHSEMSSHGLYDLRIPFPHLWFGVQVQKVMESAQIKLEPLSAQYFKIRHTCFSFKNVSSKVKAVLIDLFDPIPTNRMQLHSQAFEKCWSATGEAPGYRQMLVVLNFSESSDGQFEVILLPR